MFCQEWCLVKRTDPGLTVIPLRCKCWSCEYCRPLRHARLVLEAQAGKPDLFVTLTSVYKPGRCPHMAARAMVKAWRKVRQRHIRRHGKGSLPFLVVFEATKNGWPHMHIVARCKWLDQKWLSKLMEKYTGARIVDVRRVRKTKDVARYIAKYISKGTERFEGVKRYWRSLDYLLPPDDTDKDEIELATGWTIVKFHWQVHAEMLARSGYDLVYGRNEAFLTETGISEGRPRCPP